MARGFVRKRGDIWYAYWIDKDRKQCSKAVGTRKKDAEVYATKMQMEVNEGTFRNLKKITFPEFANRWLQDYATVQVKPSTLEGYRGILRSSLLPYFGDVALSSITTSQIQRYVAIRLAEGKAPATVQKALVLLKGMLKQAIEWDFLKINPALPVKPPKRQMVEMDFLTPEEVNLFFGAIEPKWKVFFLTLILTGMRLGELRALQWSDIDWNSETIRVRRNVWRNSFQEPKSRNGFRSIGMSPTLREALKYHLANSPENKNNLVFCNEEGNLIDDCNLRNRVFEPALKKAGLRRIRIHDLRHTYASLLINQGENLKYIQNQLGHASISTTVDIYGHLMPDSHKDASARLDESLFGVQTVVTKNFQ